MCGYADDSTFSIPSCNIDTLSTKITELYNVIAEFMSNNKLKLNGEKTHLMLLATGSAWRTKLNNDSITLNTGQDTIGTSQTEKLLGGIINQNVKWTNHIHLSEESLQD